MCLLAHGNDRRLLVLQWLQAEASGGAWLCAQHFGDVICIPATYHGSLCMQYIALAVVAGLAVGVGNYITEDLGFRLCTFMERHGQMKRLAPGTKRLYMVGQCAVCCV